MHLRARGLAQCPARLDGKWRLRVEANRFLELCASSAQVCESLISQTEVIVISQVPWGFLDGIFEEGHRNRVGSVMVVRPAKRICGIRQVWQAAPSGLSKRESHIHTFLVLDHDVGQVVRCERVFGLDRQRLLVEGLGLLPIALALMEPAQSDIEPDLMGRNSYGSLIVCNRPINLSKRSFHFWP